MYFINEVDIIHIERLTDIQLSKLLHKLITLEAEKYNLQEWNGFVPFNITTGDGGADGRIQWSGNPTKTKWLTNKYTIFQNKATTLQPANCFEEILQTEIANQPRKLKSQIEKVVNNNGCYILFTNKPIVDKGKEERIKQFRRAIKTTEASNHATFEINIYDANNIKDWVNEYISAVIFVQSCNNIHRPLGLIDWDRLVIHAKANENEFQTNDIIKENITKIRDSIKTENAIRITGHSGIGKTRLVIESFRATDLQMSIVYLNLEGNSDIIEIKSYLISNQDSQSGIIIIDNCDIKSHIILSSLVKDIGSIKIITIGLDQSPAIEDIIIKLDRENQRNLVKAIIKNKIGESHHGSDIDYINTIAEGYPWMAIRFCNAILKEGMSDLTRIPLNEFIPKLIFGLNSKDETEYNVIRACSVFSSFGFVDDSFSTIINKEIKESLKAQMDFIRTKIIDGEITETKFREICTKFLKDDILERRGTHYIVKPTILAINLAADWLQHTETDRIISIIKELKEVNLEEKFVERFKDLDQIDKAKDLVAELWGPNSPFGIAEVLNTSWGSLLFRYFVEVNPIATARTLETIYHDKSKEQIANVDKGRRNLVWALEKLCFRKESFKIASKILYSFAVSENETWSNNASNQFFQLFQIYLPGTEVSLKERLDIIHWGLKKNDFDYTKIAIIAIGRGILNEQFVRIGGAEQQGRSIPLKDYIPKSEEVTAYRSEILELLTGIANNNINNNSNSKLAKEIIAKSIRSLFRNNEGLILIKSIKNILNTNEELWIDALNNLNTVLNVESNLNEEMIKELKSVITQLTPKDIKNELLLKISTPEWNSFEKDENGIYIDKPKLLAEELAQKLIINKINWEEYILDLLQGEQRQAFSFGCKIGELTQEVEILVNKTIEKLEKINIEDQNSDLIAGILFGNDDKTLSRKIIDAFIQSENLRKHAFYLTRVLASDITDYLKLFILIEKYGYSIKNFQIFQYGRALDILSNKDVLQLCSKISQFGKSGKWTALSIIYMYSYNNEVVRNENRKFFKNIIESDNLIIGNENSERIDVFHWSDTINKILIDEKDEEFAILITKQIIEFCSQANFNYSFESYLSSVVMILLDNYFDCTWKYFGEIIIGDYMKFFHLEHFIGTKNGHFDNGEGILFRNHDNFPKILNWCRNTSNLAPERIAHMMPLSVSENGEIKWHPFSKCIIDEFGDNDNLIRQLTSNMGTYGTIGSSVPYFQKQLKLIEDLVDHPSQKINDWANEMLDHTKRTIKQEQLDDEQKF